MLWQWVADGFGLSCKTGALSCSYRRVQRRLCGSRRRHSSSVMEGSQKRQEDLTFSFQTARPTLPQQQPLLRALAAMFATRTGRPSGTAEQHAGVSSSHGMRDIALKRSGQHMKRSGLCHATNAVKMVPSAAEQRSRLPNMSIVCQVGFAILRIGWRIGERERIARRSFHRARRESLPTPPHSLSVGCRTSRPHLSPRTFDSEATAQQHHRASRTQCIATAGGRAALGVASCIPVYVNSVGKLPEHCHSSAAEGSARSGILFNPAHIRLYVEIIDTDSQTLTASPRLRRVQN